MPDGFGVFVSETSAWCCLCRGVVWDEESQRWAVCLSPADGQPQKQLGLFYTEEAAASAYDQLAVELWGPSTPTNFGASGEHSVDFRVSQH